MVQHNRSGGTLAVGRLLVVACSRRKRGRSLPAIDLYDGSAYRVLHKRNVGFYRIPVLILSAQHGLISADRVIAPYDLKMDERRSIELSEDYVVAAARALVRSLPGWPFSSVFCHGGSLYRRVFEHYAACGVFGSAEVQYTAGRIGEQLSQLARHLGK